MVLREVFTQEGFIGLLGLVQKNIVLGRCGGNGTFHARNVETPGQRLKKN